MLKIAAAFSYEHTLGEHADDLRMRLLELTGQSFRRINRYIELALYGALQCARNGVGADTALYLASEAPMLADCVKALRGVVAERRPPTPFEFMNISGNMAGFYIAQQLAMSGPQLAVHRSGASMDAALELLTVQSAQHRRALLGYVEEGVWPLAEQRWRLDLPPATPLAECSHWLYLDADCAKALVTIDEIRVWENRDALAAGLVAAPQDCRVLLGSGCTPGDADDLSRLGPAIETTSPDLPFSTGRTAAAIAAFALAPGSAHLLHVTRRDDCYRTLRVSATPG